VQGECRARELVVLVHGMGRTKLSMAMLAGSVRRAGYDVLNFGYPSLTMTVAGAGSRLADRLEGALRAGPAPRIHFVGHSLGNIVIRWVLAHRPPQRTGRIVMLAPPNQGSDLADRVAGRLAWLMKPLPELTTREGSTARTLPLPGGLEVGVVAARRDSRVTIARTHLEGQTDHVIVPGGHMFVVTRPDVRRLTIRFLRTGRFAGESPSLRAGSILG
jgi:pimeloyl-ACP methyl ester carboxylesterase